MQLTNDGAQEKVQENNSALPAHLFEQGVGEVENLKAISISGTYGSGKTTFIQTLAEEFGPDTFYIFSDGIRKTVDPSAIDAGEGAEVMSFSTGCACCQTYPQLFSTLEKIMDARSEGPSFERVVIELPGNANNTNFRQRLGRQQGIDVVGVSLINVENFERDQILGLVDRHIGQSSVVMLTWADDLELSDPKMKGVFEYIYHEQEMAVPVAVLRKDGTIQLINPDEIAKLIGELPKLSGPVNVHEHTGNQDHQHESNQSNDDHAHKHHDSRESSIEIELRGDVTFQDALARLDPWFQKDTILRIKGVMIDADSRELVHVSGTRDKINIRPLKEKEAELGTFVAVVSLEPVPVNIFSDISVELTKVASGSFMKYSTKVRAKAVTELLSELKRARQEKDLHRSEDGQLLVNYDVYDNLADYTSAPDMSEEVRKEALNELLDLRLAAVGDLVSGNYNDPYQRAASWAESLGGHIAYQMIHEPELVRAESLKKITDINPATMYFQGLANRDRDEPMQEEASPELNIDFYRDIVRYGRDKEGVTERLVREAYQRCLERDVTGQWALEFHLIEDVIQEEFSLLNRAH